MANMRLGLALTGTTLFIGFYAFTINAQVSAVDIVDQKPGVPVSLRIPDTDLDISGCVAPGSLVTILDGNSVIGSTTSDGYGQYEKSFVSQTPGIYLVGAFYEDSKGRVSSIKTVPTALTEKTLTQLQINPAPTVGQSVNSLTVGQSIVLQGSACPNTTVKVVVDNNLAIETQSNQFGDWSLTLDTFNYFIGVHTYYVAAYSNGYQSAQSRKYQFQVNASPDTAGPPPSQNISPKPTSPLGGRVNIEDPSTGYASSTREFILSGSADPYSRVEVYANNQLIGSVYADVEGLWSFVIYMYEDQIDVKVRSCRGGECGPFSDQKRYYFKGSESVCSHRIRLADYHFNNLRPGDAINLEVQNLSPERSTTFVLNWGDGTLISQSLGGDSLKLHHVYEVAGNYIGFVTAGDDQECLNTLYFTVEVRDQEDSSDLAIFLILLLLFASTIVFRRYFAKHKPNV